MDGPLVAELVMVVSAVWVCFSRRPPLPPGWYPDPWTHGSVRWFDGAAWTYHVQAPETTEAARPR